MITPTVYTRLPDGALRLWDYEHLPAAGDRITRDGEEWRVLRVDYRVGDIGEDDYTTTVVLGAWP
jgi:hypothetical protein